MFLEMLNVQHKVYEFIFLITNMFNKIHQHYLSLNSYYSLYFFSGKNNAVPFENDRQHVFEKRQDETFALLQIQQQ